MGKFVFQKKKRNFRVVMKNLGKDGLWVNEISLLYKV